MKANNAPSPERNSSAPPWAAAELVALLVILAAYIAWMLSLPCFPTTDGPVHLYYVHVLDALLHHSNPQYAHFFRIRHLLPPYSLYYYALLGLSRLVPMFVADQFIICVYFVSFAFGFRFVARALGPSADLMTLLATLLLVNWPLGMGFVNFCLSLSFSLWALGIWLRILGTDTLWKRVGFLVLVTVIMLTHPVPLLLLVSVMASILLVRFSHALRARQVAHLPVHWRADLLTWLLAALNIGYVKLFAKANPFKQVEGAEDYWVGLSSRIHGYAKEWALAVMNGPRWDLYAYRLALAAVLLVPLVMAVRQRLRNRRAGVWTAGDTFLVLGLVLLLALPLFPSQLNGLYYFADRLMMCIWIAMLLAASGWSARSGEDVFSPVAGTEGQQQPRPAARLPVPTRTAALVCIGFAVLCNALLLHSLDGLLRPAARQVAELADNTPAPRNALAFVMEDGRDRTSQVHTNITWNPFYWAGTDVLRTHDDVMINAPWMDESIIPITNTAALPEVTLPVLQPAFPNRLEKAFLKTPDQLAATLRMSRFFVVNQEGRVPLEGKSLLLQRAGDAGADWSCVPAAENTFRLCQKGTSAP